MSSLCSSLLIEKLLFTKGSPGTDMDSVVSRNHSNQCSSMQRKTPIPGNLGLLVQKMQIRAVIVPAGDSHGLMRQHNLKCRVLVGCHLQKCIVVLS